MALSLVNTFNISDGPIIALGAVSGLHTTVINGQAFLYTAASFDDGVSGFSINAAGQLTNVALSNVYDTQNGIYELNGAVALASVTIGNGQFLIVGGFDDQGLSNFAINNTSNPGALVNIAGTAGNVQDSDNALYELSGIFSLETAIVGGVAYVFAGGYLDNGISVFSVSPFGQLAGSNAVGRNITDDANVKLAGVQALAAVTLGGATYLYAAGSTDNGVSAFSVSATDGALSLVQNVSDDGTLKLAGASSLASAVVGANTYLFVGGGVDDGVSVFSVAANGTLTNVANISDDATLRLDGVFKLTTAKIAGVTYLFTASTGDGGISAFAVAADGSLINVFNVADDPVLKLGASNAVATATVGGVTYLIGSSSIENGLSVFRVDTTGLTLTGTAGNDTFDATNAPAGQLLPSDLGDFIAGLGGNDLLNGGLGDDVLDGGTGSDVLIGGLGNDTYIVDAAGDVVSEVAGQGTADRVQASRSFALGTGVDVEFLETTNAALKTAIDLAGSAIANTITGNAGANKLSGRAGNDKLVGRAGNDTLDGGSGKDRLEGGAGNDTYIIDSTADVLIDTSGIDTVRSTVSKTLAKGFEKLVLLGSSPLNGTGNASANTITGNSGKNKLDGGAGNDILIGGKGRDVLKGGAGSDDFDFNTATDSGKTSATRDVITDFTHGKDDIDLSTIDANGGGGSNGKFKFLAQEGAAFTGAKGLVRWEQIDARGTANDKTIISADINGDKKADFQIELTGLIKLTAGDFIL